MLAENLLPGEAEYAHEYRLRDLQGRILDDAALPDWMNTDEMRQAMNTLKLFSEKERDYHAYQARQNFLREQRTLQVEREQALQEKELAQQEKERAQMEKQAALRREQAALQREQAALQEKEAVLLEKQSAQAEIERLKALLAQAGQTP